MYYTQTLELFDIIRSMDSDILKIMPHYEVSYNDREFQYTCAGNDNVDNFHTFSFRWITSEEVTPIQSIQSIQSVQQPPFTVSTGTSISGTLVSNPIITSYGSAINTEYLNSCIIKATKDLTRLLTVEWTMGYNTNYVYPQAMISSTVMKRNNADSLAVMKALFLEDNKTIINGKLYSPDENADAFMEDVSEGKKNFSVLQVLDLRNKFYGLSE